MAKKTILVIDDTPSNLILLDNLLCRDYTVKVANSGSKGLQLALSDAAPDLILLDVLMPELDGFTVCDVLKNNRKTRNIPVLFLTTLHQEAEIERGLDLGAQGFIVKPVAAAALTRQIAACFSSSGPQTVVLDPA